MEPTLKGKIIHEHFLSEKTIAEMQQISSYKEFILALKDEDFEAIEKNFIFFNCYFSPGSITTTRFDLPTNSKLINIDINYLKKYHQDERVAILLHELGHAINPAFDNRTNEFNADNFVIERGFGHSLKNSLQAGIREFPEMFDNPLNHERITRIKV